MRLRGTIWLREVVDKLAFKHGVETNEVEEILNNKPKVRLVERGKRKGEMFTRLQARLMPGDTYW